LSPIKAAGSESQAAALPQTRSLACRGVSINLAGLPNASTRANFGTWSAARSADRLHAFFSCTGAMLMSARWSYHRHVFVIVIARHTLKMRPTTPRFARWYDTTSDLGRLMITNMGGIAAFERGLIRKRCEEVTRRRKASSAALDRALPASISSPSDFRRSI
jgi:hypothetical protein